MKSLMSARRRNVLAVIGISAMSFIGTSYGQWTRSSPSTRLQYNTDNVGVGIQVPTAKFQVCDPTTTAGQKIVFLGTTMNTSCLPGIKLSDGTNTRTVLGLRTGDITVDNSGKIGIGTTHPQTTLAVNGIITAKEVKVTQLGWSDFVFSDNYKLKPLDQVAQYVKKNKHLEGIPTATEVKKNGVAVGDMQAKLLEKVEELTLHMIAMKKENDELKTKVSALEVKLGK